MTSIIVLLVTFFIYLPIALLVNTWAVSVLWGWYLTPYLPVPSFFMLMGLLLTVRLIKGMNTSADRDTDEDKYAKIGRLFAPIILAPIVVFVGWIILQFT